MKQANFGLLVVMVLLFSCASVFADDATNVRLITVTGEAEVSIPPNEVVFDLTIQTLHKDRLGALTAAFIFLASPYVVQWSGRARIDCLALALLRKTARSSIQRAGCSGSTRRFHLPETPKSIKRFLPEYF